LQFGLDHSISKEIISGGRIDSLIFKIDQNAAVFHMVDLGYLKNIDATIKIETDQSDVLLADFGDLLKKDGLQMKPDECDMTTHLLSNYGDYFVINFTETIPEEWVTRDQVPPDKLSGLDEIFRVISSNGQIQIDPPFGGAPVENPQIGARLPGGSVIKASPDSYLALLHSSGQTVELRGGKEYDLDELASGLENQELDEIRQLIDFVMNETLEIGTDNGNTGSSCHPGIKKHSRN